MHKSGIALIWVAVVLALGAIYLTARVYDVRNSWQREIDTLAEANQKRAADIEQKQTAVRNLQQQYAATMRNWGPYWFPVQAAVGQDGTITLGNLGADHGLGRTGAEAAADAAAPGVGSKPTVFLFAAQPDGSGSKYIGSFAIQQLARTSAQLAPTWLVSPQEVQQWQGQAWRVRTNIPSGPKDRFRSLRADLITAFNYLADKQRDKTINTEAVQEAQQILDNRVAELQGDAAQPELPGLVAQLAQAEDERNQELAELDRLRREVQRVYERRGELVQELKTRPEQVSE